MKPNTLQQAVKYFSDEQVCIDTVAAMRWPAGKPVCPACEHTDHYYLKTQKRWKCKECGRQFSVKLNTIFEDSPISLDKWLIALWMLVNCKNGISSYEVSRNLGLTQKSAWFVLQRLRLALKDGDVSKFGGEGSVVEVDETYVGQKARNMHKSKKIRLNQARGEIRNPHGTVSSRYMGKTPVQGLLDRVQRKVRATVVSNLTRETLQAKILSQVERGSTVYTDNAISYEKALSKDFVHGMVNHLQGYVNGRVHTNGIENFWSLLKRSLHGSYVAVEPFHLFRYVDEQVFRYNNRGTKKEKVTDADRFELALSQVAGKRLTFAEVTGRVGERAAI
jgi:transposase-like protein